MTDDEVQRAARQHREKVAREAAAAVPVDLEAAKRRYADEMIELALGPLGAGSGIVVVIDALLVGGLAALAIRFAPDSENLRLAGMFGLSLVALVLCIFVIPNRVGTWLAARRRRELGALGYGFDAPAYLARLTEQRRDSRLVVSLGFARAWEPDAAAALPDAIAEWMPELEPARWESGELRLVSRELHTVDAYGGRGRSLRTKYFTNEKVHTCFREVLVRVLPKVAAACPISTLRAEIEGTVVPFDEDP